MTEGSGAVRMSLHRAMEELRLVLADLETSDMVETTDMVPELTHVVVNTEDGFQYDMQGVSIIGADGNLIIRMLKRMMQQNGKMPQGYEEKEMRLFIRNLGRQGAPIFPNSVPLKLFPVVQEFMRNRRPKILFLLAKWKK